MWQFCFLAFWGLWLDVLVVCNFYFKMVKSPSPNKWKKMTISFFIDSSSSYSLKNKNHTSFGKPFKRRFIWDQAQFSSSIRLEIITIRSGRGQNPALPKISFPVVSEKRVYMRYSIYLACSTKHLSNFNIIQNCIELVIK